MIGWGKIKKKERNKERKKGKKKRTRTVDTGRHSIVGGAVTAQTGVTVVRETGDGSSCVHSPSAHLMSLGGQITGHGNGYAHGLTGRRSQRVTVRLGHPSPVTGRIAAPGLRIELDAFTGIGHRSGRSVLAVISRPEQWSFGPIGSVVSGGGGGGHPVPHQRAGTVLRVEGRGGGGGCCGRVGTVRPRLGGGRVAQETGGRSVDGARVVWVRVVVRHVVRIGRRQPFGRWDVQRARDRGADDRRRRRRRWQGGRVVRFQWRRSRATGRHWRFFVAVHCPSPVRLQDIVIPRRRGRHRRSFVIGRDCRRFERRFGPNHINELIKTATPHCSTRSSCLSSCNRQSQNITLTSDFCFVVLISNTKPHFLISLMPQSLCSFLVSFGYLIFHFIHSKLLESIHFQPSYFLLLFHFLH